MEYNEGIFSKYRNGFGIIYLHIAYLTLAQQLEQKL